MAEREHAPQQARENLAEHGLTPEQAAANEGLSVGGRPRPPTEPSDEDEDEEEEDDG